MVNRLAVSSGLAITTILALIAVGESYAVTNNFSAVHFPTLLPNIMIDAPEGLDNRFTDMLVELGVGYAVFEEDPWLLQSSPYAEARLISAIEYSRSQGLTIHIVNQEIVGYYERLNISAPPDLTYQEFHDLFVELNIYLASTFRPDRLTVLAEPQHYQRDIGSNFTVSQWMSIAVDSARAVKAVNSSIQTWIDALSTDSLDYEIARQVSGKAVINGVGYDLYHSDMFNSVVLSASYAKMMGKKVGFTEIWPIGDLYAYPELDNASYAQAEAKGINSTYARAKQNGLTGIFNPFFAEKLVFLDPLPLPFQVNTTAMYLSNLDMALMQGNRTVIFNSYQALISDVSSR